ncbi:MAG: ATP-binding protein [bacterium]|nr:ATP-binding protein [bacterium]
MMRLITALIVGLVFSLILACGQAPERTAQSPTQIDGDDCVIVNGLPSMKLSPAAFDSKDSIAAFRCMRLLEDSSATPRLDFAEARALLDGGPAKAGDVVSGAGLEVQSGFQTPPVPGRSASVFWLRVAIQNSGRAQTSFLVIDRARLSEVDLYHTPEPGGDLEILAGGDQVPPSQRAYLYRYPVFPIQLPAGGDAVFYLRVHSPGALVTLPLSLRSPAGQRLAELYETVVLGAYFGILAVMFVYNAVLFMTLRIRAYLYYILYMAAFAVTVLIYQGVFPLLLSPESFAVLQPFNARLFLFCIHLAAVFGMYFIGAFLHSGQNDLLDRLSLYPARGVALLLLVHVYEPLLFFVSGPLFLIFFIGLPVIGMAFGLYRSFRGHRVGSYFLIAWGVVLVAVVELFLEHEGWVPYGTIGRHGILFGSAAEMTLLSIGLADHFRRIEMEGARARAASRAKTSFLANMSHEIRTPLNAILGMSDLLGEAPLGKTERGYVEVLRRAGQGLLGLINDILDLSKIESGKLEVERTNFDLRELTEDTAEILAPAARKRGIGFEYRLDPGLPTVVLGDPVRLRQVLLNLLSNAVKFTERGSVEVDIAPAAAADGPERIRFHIRDTGIGIPEDKLLHIFDSFAQADESTTRRYGGTGLGLAISHSLVALMGGELRVRSVPKKGSDFWFDLPLAIAPVSGGPSRNGEVASLAPDRSAMADRASEGVADPARDPGLRILLAEDNADNQMLFYALLKKFTHEIETAENGSAAVKLSAQTDFDLIFMDIQMPEMDGLEATRRIREREKQANRRRVPIFALSAHAMQEDASRSLAAGCDGHLTKPIDRARLLEIIAQFQGAGSA